jgi:hypothetical protein
MDRRADVASIEALEQFRARLVVCLDDARLALDEVRQDVLRARQWLRHDQRAHLEGLVRRRTQAVEEAKQAHFSASLSTFRGSTDTRAALHRAKRALEEAERKLDVLKQWNTRYDSDVEPLARQLERLANLLTETMPKGVHGLAQVINTLHEYAGTTPPQVSAPGETPVHPEPDAAPETGGDA